jgi:hypothetical protein
VTEKEKQKVLGLKESMLNELKRAIKTGTAPMLLLGLVWLARNETEEQLDLDRLISRAADEVEAERKWEAALEAGRSNNEVIAFAAEFFKRAPVFQQALLADRFDAA